MTNEAVPSISKLVDIVQTLAEHHAETSKGDFANLEDRLELKDIADDAWHHAGIPDLEYMFEDDRKSMYSSLGRGFIHAQIEEHTLGRFYRASFEKAVITKYHLTF